MFSVSMGGGGGVGGGVGECMGCEMDMAFIEVSLPTLPQRTNETHDRPAQAYTGEGTPFGPTALLLAMWKASAELAGHEQQGQPPPRATQ